MNLNADSQQRFQADGCTVHDRLSGLDWMQDLAPAGWPRFWNEALDFIANLNNRLHLGYSDWRLPNRRELFSLLDYGQKNPALTPDHPFEGLELSWYWSSTSYAGDPAYAWYVHTEGGRMFYGDKGRSYLVWPVRGESEILAATGQVKCFGGRGRNLPCRGSGQDGELAMGRPWPRPRFRHTGGTVRDQLTGLTWSRNADLAGGPVSWHQAVELMQRLDQEKHAGKSGWRLPSIQELESLVDASAHHPALPAGHPFQVVRDQYWSATTSGFDPDWAMALYMDKGGVGVGLKERAEYAVWGVCG